MKRILFCTVDSWNTRNSSVSSNTYANLFKDYPQECMAALYIREELSDSLSCSRYFQISEQKIIKSVFSRSIETGRELLPQAIMTEEDIANIERKNLLYNRNRSRNIFKIIAREVIWALGRWKTKELDNFLESYNPDIIIFSFESYIHFNRICKYVVRKTKSKAIGYVWDDTFTYKPVRHQLGFRVFRFFQRLSLRSLSKYCSACWAISPKTKQEVDSFFGFDSIVVSKPVDMMQSIQDPKELNMPYRIIYTGNLAIGRFESLLLLSDVLKEINEGEAKFVVDVYTNTFLDSEQRSKLCDSVRIHKSVPVSEVDRIQKDSHILLFLESLDERNKYKARLSFSTKITDYLSKQKCIIAIGDPDIAPMEYLSQEKAALCVSSRTSLYDALKSLVDEPTLIQQYGKSAYECGIRNHSREIINERIYTSLNHLYNEDSSD